MKAAGLALACLFALATDASAHTVLPTLYSGTGAAEDGVIDIHAGPDDATPVIGHIPADSRDVEVVAFDDSEEWGRVNHDEASGWLPLARLHAQNNVWPAIGLPERTLCFGTEPFWSLKVNGDVAEYSTPDRGAATLPVTGILASGASDDPRRVILTGDATVALTLSMTPGYCSDRMSDRAFGLTAHVIRQTGALPDLLLGCCTIAP